MLRTDDRAVRDSERKAALMHFATDQATQMTEHPPSYDLPQRPPNARAEHVKTLRKPPAGIYIMMKCKHVIIHIHVLMWDVRSYCTKLQFTEYMYNVHAFS